MLIHTKNEWISWSAMIRMWWQLLLVLPGWHSCQSNPNIQRANGPDEADECWWALNFYCDWMNIIPKFIFCLFGKLYLVLYFITGQQLHSEVTLRQPSYRHDNWANSICEGENGVWCGVMMYIYTSTAINSNYNLRTLIVCSLYTIYTTFEWQYCT